MDLLAGIYQSHQLNSGSILIFFASGKILGPCTINTTQPRGHPYLGEMRT